MNNIEAIKYKSKFASEEHLVISVDGRPLDLLLEDIFKDENHIGLVPVISWLDNPKERKLAIDTISPSDGEKTIAPLLVCPDDQDLSCTVIVAEIESSENSIIWKRLGIDKTALQNPPLVGLDVEWYERVKPMKFDLVAYKKCIQELKNEEA